MIRQYVLASGNQGKLGEIAAMLEPLGFMVQPQSHWQVPEAEETAGTFVENSLIKARQAARYTGLPAIADDSGLVVPFLNGAPGIYSSRYAGHDANDQSNITRLLEKLGNAVDDDRRAYFYCAVVMVCAFDDPAPLIAIGRWHGRILLTPQGGGGFGYDPVFAVASLSKPGHLVSAAELSAEEKSGLSHRGQALKELVRQLDALAGSGRS